MFRFILGVLFVLCSLTTAEAAPPDIIKVRLLCLKHSPDKIAVDDANLVIKEMEKAASSGLKIKNIGNHAIDKDGKRQRVLYFNKINDLPKLRAFISEQLKIDAEPGDTVLLFTVGHGGTGGGLHRLGSRKEVLETIAGAAEENNQKLLWWQLSCYASAKLPEISTLNKRQQGLINIITSSGTSNPSAAYVEYKPIGKMLMAMAKKGKDIDPNQDGSINAKELQDFLNSTGYTRQLRYLNASDRIFGLKSLANMIPIVDRNNPQGEYDPFYIPMPRR